MAITFGCEGCGRRYQVDEALAGKAGKCKACGQRFVIPSAAQAEAPPAPARATEPAPVTPTTPRPVESEPHPGPARMQRLLLWSLSGVGLLVAMALAAPYLVSIVGRGPAAAPGEGPGTVPATTHLAENSPAAPAPPVGGRRPPAEGPAAQPVRTPAPPATPHPAPATPPPAPRIEAAPPASPALDRAAEARRKLDADENRDRQGELQPAFNEALRAAAPALHEVPVGTSEQPSRFTRMILNDRKLGFDGIRFKAPASGPRRDMKWEFIMPAVENDRGRDMKAWYIMPLSGDMGGFRNYVMGKDGPVPGVDLPRKFHVVQYLPGAEIRPGNEYLIWFSFEPTSPAVPTYVKIDLVPPQPEVQARLDATQAALRRTIELPEPPCGLGVSPDGKTLLVAAGATLYDGDLAGGPIRKRWEGPAGNVRTVAFSPDGKTAAVGCGDGKILLVDLKAGKPLATCEGHTAGLRCLAFLPGGKQLASGAEDQTARLWDAATGKEVRKFAGHTDQILCLAVSHDGRRLVTGPSVGDKVGRVWDLATGRLIARLEGNGEAIYALGFSPDGKTVLTGGEDSTLRLYETASGRPIRRFKPDAGSAIHALAFLGDGRRVVVGAEGNFLTFWSASAGRFLSAYEGPLGGFPLLTLVPGESVLTASGDHALRLWSLPTPASTPDPPIPTKADLAYLKTAVDDLDADSTERLDELKSLDLNERVDDAGLAHLSRLGSLESLRIRGAKRVRGPGLDHLRPLAKLRQLDLSATGVDDAGLAHVARLTGLNQLDLSRTRVTNVGMSHLKALKSLTNLNLSHTAVGDSSLEALADLSGLETLNLTGTKVDDRGLTLLRGLKALKSVSLGNSQVSGAGLDALRKAMPDLDVTD